MKPLDCYFLTEDRTIRDAIKNLDDGAAKLALVVDKNKKLIGTISDGDIRRGLLRGENLESSLLTIIQRNFFSFPEGMNEAEALLSMRNKGLYQVPQIYHDGTVKRLFLHDDLLRIKKFSNSVVIMAGGKGERLKGLTLNCPKPMLLVGNKPMLQIIIENCISAGFSNFYLSINYLGEKIREYFEDGAKWGVNFKYIEEEMPLGTAGALSLIVDDLVEPLLVMNGDVLTSVNFADLMSFHNHNEAEITVCARKNSVQIPFGVLSLNDKEVIDIQEKPTIENFINAGIYVINPALLRLIPINKRYDMSDLIKSLLDKKINVCGFPLHEQWIDVGVPEALLEANSQWQRY
jgi:dTDP-glucose pyrophosphorylase